MILQLVLVDRPHIFWAIKYGYVAMLFTTPFILSFMAFSLLFIAYGLQGGG